MELVGYQYAIAKPRKNSKVSPMGGRGWVQERKKQEDPWFYSKTEREGS